MNAYFVIVGTNDNPIYEVDSMKDRDEKYIHQFVIHSALDLVDDFYWTTNAKYSLEYLLKLPESCR